MHMMLKEKKKKEKRRRRRKEKKKGDRYEWKFKVTLISYPGLDS